MSQFSNPASLTDVQVNSTTANDQRLGSRRSIATSGSGGSVVVWQSIDQDGSSAGIFARRLDATGQPQGAEIAVNQTTDFNQSNAAVAIDAAGNFVVVWQSRSTDTENDIYARRFNADGTSNGDEFLVNLPDPPLGFPFDQEAPNIALTSDGGFIVTWSSLNQDGSGLGVYARRFDADGTAGGETLVNQTTSNNQSNASIAAGANGEFVVAWTSSGQVNSTDVFFRRFQADGTAIDAQDILVNQQTSDRQQDVSVAIAANGDVILTWSSLNQDGDGWGVYARRFKDGIPQGNEFLVNTIAGSQQFPSVAIEPTGEFVIAWTNTAAGGSDIYARRFNAAGVAQSREFLVNAATAGIQEGASIALEADGDATIAWTTITSSTVVDVATRRFNLSALPTTTGISDLTLPDNAPDFEINLYDKFDDAQTSDSNLIYQVISISNSSLFNGGTPNLNAATGILTLDFVQGISGNSNVTIRATDTNDFSVETTFRVTRSPTLRPPIVSVTTAAIAYSENAQGTILDSALTLTDQDSTTLASATITIDNFAAGDRLSVDSNLAQSLGLTVSAISNGITISKLSGSPATLLQYQGLLRTLAYSSSSENPTAGDRTIRLQVNDGGLNSNSATRIITVLPVNDEPTLTVASGNLTYTEGEAAVAIDSLLTLADVDDVNLDRATVEIVNFAAGDELSFDSSLAQSAGLAVNLTSGRLILTGSASIAQYQTVLQSVAYRNTTPDPTGDRTIRFVVNDGEADSVGRDRTVRIIPVNAAPIVTVPNTPLGYTENQAAASIAAGFNVTDSDSANLTGATVRITNFAAGDRLDVAIPNGSTLSQTFSSGVLTLSGTASVSDYQTILRSLTYRNSSENPIGGDRTIRFEVSDPFTTSDPIDRTITVTPVNDPPLIATSGTTAYIENAAAGAIANDLTLSDVDNSTIASATVRIANFVAGQDELSFTASYGITGSFSGDTLTLTGNVTTPATIAQFEEVLRSLTYRNSSDNPNPANRSIEFRVNDGAAPSAIATRTVTVAAVNDAPLLTFGTATPTYTENAAAVSIDPALTVSDPDSTTISSATITITNYVSGQDFLDAAVPPGITKSFSNGVLTLSNPASIAQYQTILRSLTYRNSSENPDSTPRILQFALSDGTNSTPFDRTVTVVPVNDAPQLISSAGTVSFTEGTSPALVDGGLTLSDIDDANLEGATVTIANYKGGQDQLSVTADGISIVSNSGGILTLTGSATVEQYQTVLRSIAYSNSSRNPDITARTIQFIVNDGQFDSNQGTRTVNVFGANDAPIVTIPASAVTYREGEIGVAIAPSLTLDDTDSPILRGATVTLENASAQEVLRFADQGAIRGTLSGGVLTLTGAAAIADYQTALQSIAYSNSSENPSAASRTIRFSVTDGTSSSLPVSQTLQVQPVNDAPTIAGSSGTISYAENNPGLAIDPNLLLADVDNPSLNGAIVRISNNYVAEDFLNFTDQAGITSAYSAGVLTLTGTASLAAYQAALRSIAYFNNSENPDIRDRTIQFEVSDGEFAATSRRTIAITSTPERPIVTLTAAPLNYSEGQGAIAIDTAIDLNDLDSPILQGATIRLTNFVPDEDQLSFIAPAGFSSTLSGGTLTIAGAGSIEQYKALLKSITYTNTSTNPSTTPRSIEFTVSDGGLSSVPVTRSIEITAFNSPPVLTVSTGAIAYRENAPGVAIDPGLTLTDADSVTIANATVRIANGSSDEALSFTNQAGITGNFSGGVLSLTGAAAVTAYQTALRSIVYSNQSENPTASDRPIEFIVNDGALNSNTVQRTVTLLPVNDAPIVTASAGTVRFIEGGSAVVIDGGIALSDVDSPTIDRATVAITGNFAEGQDVLSFTGTGTIRGSFNAQGILTLSGAASIADYQIALQQVTFSNSSQNPSLSDRTIAFTAIDSSQQISLAATRRLTIQSLNSPPVILPATGALTFVEDAPAIAIAPDLLLADIDSTTLSRATVTITNFAAEDVLSFTNQSGITGNFRAGVLTLTGTAAIASYQTALKSITYRNSSNTPTLAARSIEIVVNDSNRDSIAATRTITVRPTNDAPIVAPTSGSAIYAGEAVAIDPTLQISDPDSPTLSGATVRISSFNFFPAQDQLSFTSQNGITGIFDGNTGILRLSGTASVSSYQTALQSIAYRNLGTPPISVDRQIEFLVSDDQRLQSAGVVRNVQFSRGARPPQIAIATTPVTYTENQAGIAIDPGLTVRDADSPFLARATVRIGGYVAGQDFLNFENQNNIFGSFDRTTGVLTLRGPAALTNFEAALQSITYTNSSESPNSVDRTIEFSISDSSSTSVPVTRSLRVVAVNDAPAIAVSSEPLAYRRTGGAAQIAAGIALSDADSSTLSSATVSIDGFSAQDQLRFTSQNGISSAFSAGVLTLTGTASIAQYQAALESITYSNASPDGRLRILRIRVSDGIAQSATVSRPLQSATNYLAPVLDLNGLQVGTDFAAVYRLSTPPVQIVSPDLSLNDVDSPTIASAVVAIANPLNWPSERLDAVTAGTGISADYNAAGGRLTLIGIASRSSYQQVLRSIVYSNSDSSANLTPRQIVFTVNDGEFSSELVASIVSFGAGQPQGTPEIDRLVTTIATDSIDALGSNDLVTSTLANLQQSDSINGGADSDTLVITDGTGELMLNLGSADNQLTGAIAATTRIFNFERFDLRQFGGSTTQTGSNTDDVMIGAIGRNRISAGAGSDTILGNGGDDILDGGTGSDTLTGGAGNDLYRVDSSDDRLIEAVNEGLDTIESTISYSLSSNIENLTLIGQATVATGNEANNQITGNSLNNQLAGAAGSDVLLGNSGSDTLTGEVGDDLLNGGEGRDRLSGGAGRDTFALGLTRRSRDVITDFSSADDAIAISASLVRGMKFGNLSRRQFTRGQAASDRDDRFVYSRSSGALFYDADGSGQIGAVQIATIANRSNLTAANFMILR